MRIILAAAIAATALSTPAFAQDGGFSGPRAEVVAGYDSVKDGSDADIGSDGFLYGGAIGYDVQSGKLVFGAEGEVTFSTTSATETGVFAAGDRLRAEAGRDLYAGARIGYAVTPSTLLYAKVGYTNARLETSYTLGTTTTEVHDDLDGVRVGAGVEMKLTGNVYAKAEYRYSHYSQSDDLEVDIDRHQLLGGIGIRF